MKGAFRFPLIAGGSNPDPATYCPANGYIIDPTIYYPPITIGTPSAEEILLLCSNESPGMVSVKATTSSGQYTTTVYDSENNVISTQNANSNVAYNYTFPTGALAYYKVKISPATGGASITGFTTYNTVTGQNYNWPIKQAKFNTPNITTLSSAFRIVPQLQECIFDCTLNSLTTMAGMFQNGGCLSFTFPSLTYSALTTMADMFYNNTIIRKINLKDAVFPALTTLSNFARNATRVDSFTLPAADMNAVTTIAYLVNGCYALSGKLTFPNMTSLPYTGMTSCCANTTSLTEAEFKAIASNQTAFNYSSIFSGSQIKKLTFPNNVGLAIESSSILCDVTHYVLPANCLYAGNVPIWYTANKISISGGDNSTQTGVNQFDINLLGSNLETIDCPAIRCSRLVIGLTGYNCKVTYVNIDWANSSFAGNSSIKLYAKLDATELNRIFNLLPSMSATIFIKGNPGAGTCNQSIATAKGWAVNTTT